MYLLISKLDQHIVEGRQLRPRCTVRRDRPSLKPAILTCARFVTCMHMFVRYLILFATVNPSSPSDLLVIRYITSVLLFL